MTTRRSRFALRILALVLVALATARARAEEVEKKFRIGFAAGGFSTQSSVRSDAANTLVVLDETENVVDFFDDPRNDQASLGELQIKPAIRATASVSYAFTRMFVLEASVGYQKGDVGDIEVQAQFNNQVIPINQDFDFRIFRMNAGTITEVPIQLTAIARFRPKASFNPYIGAGVGYTLVGYEPSDDMNALSANIDASRGGFSALSGSGFTGLNLGEPQDIGDLSGATVSARDSFEWHAVGGVEYSFHSKWAMFLDFRYIFASREVNIGFNGEQSIGISVPNTAATLGDPVASAIYGAMGVTEGGFVDGGHLEPPPGQGTDHCITDPGECTWVETPDGQVDAGKYYVKGGKIRYGGASIQIGIRYTF